MLLTILRRLAGTALVFLLVAVLVFLMLRLAPGDPAVMLVGEHGTAEDVAQVRKNLRLDEPLPTQLAVWLGRALQGDLGRSFYHQKPVAEVIQDRMGPTFFLAIMTLAMTVTVAIPLGVLAAWRHGTWVDRGVLGLSVLGFSLPSFVLGYVLIWLVAIKGGLLPAQGYQRLGEGGLWTTARYLILPAITLTIVYTALIARVTRATVAEALTEDYVRTARSKGLSEARVMFRHALANSAVPIVTVVAVGVAMLISGVVVTETVYAIPGLGLLTVDAVQSRDYPVIQGVTLFFSAVYVLVNLLVDISYLLLDPRIRY